METKTLFVLTRIPLRYQEVPALHWVNLVDGLAQPRLHKPNLDYHHLKASHKANRDTEVTWDRCMVREALSIVLDQEAWGAISNTAVKITRQVVMALTGLDTVPALMVAAIVGDGVPTMGTDHDHYMHVIFSCDSQHALFSRKKRKVFMDRSPSMWLI